MKAWPRCLFGPRYLGRRQFGLALRRASLIVLGEKLQRPAGVLVGCRGGQVATSARESFELIRPFHMPVPPFRALTKVESRRSDIFGVPVGISAGPTSPAAHGPLTRAPCSGDDDLWIAVDRLPDVSKVPATLGRAFKSAPARDRAGRLVESAQTATVQLVPARLSLPPWGLGGPRVKMRRGRVPPPPALPPRNSA